MGGSEEDVWHRVMRWRQMAAGAILLPFCFLKLERLRFYIKKNGKTGENFESVHTVSMAFVAKKQSFRFMIIINGCDKIRNL